MRALLIAATAAAMALPGLALAAGSSGGVPVDGMPQLAFGHPTQGRYLVASVFWLLVIFGILYFVMAKYALPQVGEVLEARAARIAADLEAAQSAKAEADAAMAAHREGMARARADAQTAINTALQNAQRDAQARTDALNQRLAQQVEEAEARIAAARGTAMGALREVALDTAQSLIAKVAGRAEPAAVSAAVDRALAARRA